MSFEWTQLNSVVPFLSFHQCVPQYFWKWSHCFRQLLHLWRFAYISGCSFWGGICWPCWVDQFQLVKQKSDSCLRYQLCQLTVYQNVPIVFYSRSSLHQNWSQFFCKWVSNCTYKTYLDQYFYQSVLMWISTFINQYSCGSVLFDSVLMLTSCVVIQWVLKWVSILGA